MTRPLQKKTLRLFLEDGTPLGKREVDITSCNGGTYLHDGMLFPVLTAGLPRGDGLLPDTNLEKFGYLVSPNMNT